MSQTPSAGLEHACGCYIASAIEDLSWWAATSGTVIAIDEDSVKARSVRDRVEAFVTIPKGHL